MGNRTARRGSWDYNRLIFEYRERSSGEGYFPKPDVSVRRVEEILPRHLLRRVRPVLPSISERSLVRHYTILSRKNFSVDTNFYPLGSCTMKYNPRISERAARLAGFQQLHPYQDEGTLQGILQVLFDTAKWLALITGMDAVSLQPSAGAHGEVTGVLIITKYLQSKGEKRTKVLIPDSAHGTNPASCALCGYEVETVRSDKRGEIDLDDLRAKLDERVSTLMLTNPNTLGIFEEDIVQIAEAVHNVGAQLYMDGANLNAIAGIARPGDFGVDVLHLNLHKTFSTPHGAGGPGSGPVAVRKHLEEFLPVPAVRRKDGTFFFDYDLPLSIGKVRSFYGNIPVILRAYVYLRLLGWEGLRDVAGCAVLNANYLLKKLSSLERPFTGPRLHEFVLSLHSLRRHNLRAMDVCKALLDYGFHPPTVNFPLIVREALMVEPTETETKSTLDSFALALLEIVGMAERDSDHIRSAPHTTPVARLDEVKASRELRVRWTPGGS